MFQKKNTKPHKTTKSVRSDFAFDQALRSTDLHIRFQAQREFGIEFESVARLITANMVLLVNI